MVKNYIDDDNVYHNFENKTLKQIYDEGFVNGLNAGEETTIKELEQIRAEIDALDKWGQTFYRYNMALGDCIEIIDNHIEELKGETNAE